MNKCMLFLPLADWKDMATILGVLITSIALVKGIFEYILQGKQKRAETFFNLRKKLKEKEEFAEICVRLARKKDLSDFSDAYKRDFLGLIEEVAVMKNSGLIKEDLAFYFFGWYAMACMKDDSFWSNYPRNHHNWAIFEQFARDAELYDKTWEKNFDPNWVKI